MPSMIESLIGGGVARQDEKRVVPTRRPMPTRPRDVFELLCSLGTEASMASFFMTTQFHAAEPRLLTYIALNRWITESELAEIAQPYNPQTHIRTLLTGAEFRASLIRRICEAYPERTRLCYVRIPRCAGQHFLTMADAMHPIVPPDLAANRRTGEAPFIRALGTFLGRFTLTKTIMLVQPNLAPFIQANAPPVDDTYAAAGLRWNLNPPPRRSGDRLFTILREPRSLILSEVNATLDALLKPAESDTPDIAAWRLRLPRDPATVEIAAHKRVARQILRMLPTRNPICHALADGTAQAAFSAVRLQDVELADLSHYPDWTKYTWDVEPEPAANTSTPHLTLADLNPADSELLDAIIAEDLRFYAPVKVALDKLEGLKSSVRGRDL